MLDTFKQLTANQFEASLRTLNACIDRCPESIWNAPVAMYPYCQVVFHTLFFTDFYLEPNETTFREQAFHRDNVEFFADYEQLQDREPVSLYERPSLKSYLQHCRDKALSVIAAESAETLCGPSGFERRACTRAELHVYNMRHICHHAAQLSLRLRLDSGDGVPWFGSGWTDSRK